jgi:hypothetical protein
LSDDGKRLLVLGFTVASVWDIDEERRLSRWTVRGGLIASGDIDADGSEYAVGMRDGTVVILAADNGVVRGRFRAGDSLTAVWYQRRANALGVARPSYPVKTYSLPLLVREDISDAVWSIGASMSVDDIDDVRPIGLRISSEPASEQLTIEAQGLAGSTGRITLADAGGRVIDLEEVTFVDDGTRLTVDCSRLPSGWYTCLVTSGTERAMQAFAIVR